MDIAEQLAGRELPPAIGDNNPPPPTPYEIALDEIDTLYGEAVMWLDGKPVDSQDVADGLSNMLNMIRAAKKRADESRMAENEPFDAGKAEVQARYKPLLAKAERARDTIVTVLTPWLEQVARAKAAKAEAARIEADRKLREAQEAIRNSPENLAARELAEEQLKAAKKAGNAATRMEKDTAKSGTVGRAVGLRTTWKPTLTDGVAAARHYWATERQEMEAFLLVMAAKEVARGKRDIPGFDIQEIRSAV